jgi:hypothetical protein
MTRAFQSTKRANVDLELYTVGRGFELAGDLSSNNNCSYYVRAVKAFQEEMQFIKGDGYTDFGQPIQLGPVRGKNEETLERVKAKFAKAEFK